MIDVNAPARDGLGMLSMQLAIRARVMRHLNSQAIESWNAASILDSFVIASQIAGALIFKRVRGRCIRNDRVMYILISSSFDRQGRGPHVRRELRYCRQLGDRQRAFCHPVGRHGANDLQPVRAELDAGTHPRRGGTPP